MKLLLNERNLIVAIGSSIEYGVWGNVDTASSWKITNTSYMMDDNYSVVDIGEIIIPSYVKEWQYYYIDGEFKLADECPNEYKDRIKTLEESEAILTDCTADLMYELSLSQLGIA